MRSHTYKLPHRDMLTIVGLPIGGVLLLGMIIRLIGFIPFAPPPRPTLDVDRTVIVQQIDASNRADQADILLIGDSSCLMNIDAALLSEISGKQVTNLGTLSFLDIHTFCARRPLHQNYRRRRWVSSLTLSHRVSLEFLMSSLSLPAQNLHFVYTKLFWVLSIALQQIPQ